MLQMFDVFHLLVVLGCRGWWWLICCLCCSRKVVPTEVWTDIINPHTRAHARTQQDAWGLFMGGGGVDLSTPVKWESGNKMGEFLSPPPLAADRTWDTPVSARG